MEGPWRQTKAIVASFYQEYGLYSVTIVVSVIVILLTTILYVCCHVLKTKSPQRIKVYGRILEVPSRSGAKRKAMWVDPFRLSGLDMLRKFEDAVANLLYAICNEIAIGRLDNYRITFLRSRDGKDDDQYILDYLWMMSHLYHNGREYAFLFTSTKDGKTREAVLRHRGTPLTLLELKQALGASRGPPYKAEVVYSFSHHLRSLCGELRDEFNARAYSNANQQLLEEFESTNKDVRSRAQAQVLHTMGVGLELAELMKLLIPTSSKTIKDQYNIMTRTYSVFNEEYIPYLELAHGNRKKYQELDPETREVCILSALEDITGNAYQEQVWELMAISVLPRFRRSL